MWAASSFWPIKSSTALHAQSRNSLSRGRSGRVNGRNGHTPALNGGATAGSSAGDGLAASATSRPHKIEQQKASWEGRFRTVFCRRRSSARAAGRMLGVMARYSQRKKKGGKWGRRLGRRLAWI